MDSQSGSPLPPLVQVNEPKGTIGTVEQAFYILFCMYTYIYIYIYIYIVYVCVCVQ